jgi:hypothetical protein
MTTRQRLPDRRLAESFELEVAGLHYTCIGRFPDGRIGEIFLISIALQFGADLETIRRGAGCTAVTVP